MVVFRKLERQIKRLIRLRDLDDIPPASLLFLGGCLILALIGYVSWRSDRTLLANRPSTSNVAESVENALSFPLFSLVTILVGLLGAAVIYFIQS